MIEKEKLNELSAKLVSNRDNYMDSLRKNLYLYVDDKDITMKDIAEAADIPINTLNSLLYGSTKDCKLSTIIKLARVLNVSIDELVGSETMWGEAAEMISIARTLPDNSIYLIKWFIRHQESVNRMNLNHKVINVMKPRRFDKDSFTPANDFITLNIDDYPDSVKSKVFIGIQLRSDHYMPYFTPYDTVLIANDRNAFWNEFVVIVYYGELLMVRRVEKTENGMKKVYYTHVRDEKIVMPEEEIDEVIGYVAAVYTEDSSMMDQ